MQIINKGQNNFLVFTLTEKVTLNNPYYLFSFKHQVLMSSVNFIASDVSGFPTRYNKFLITETTGVTNLTSGIVSLPETGFYEYAIYQQASSSNLNVANAEGLGYIETLVGIDYSLVPTAMKESFSIMDILFYGIAGYEGYKFAFRVFTNEDLSKLEN